MNKKIRVLIADDHTLVRKGMITFVANEPGIDIVGEVADDIEVVEEDRSHKPDLILLEMIMPRQNGLETIEKIKREYPAASILVVTGFSEEQIVFPVIKTRAFGYLLKDSSPQQLLQSIYDVHNGESSLDPNIALKRLYMS